MLSRGAEDISLDTKAFYRPIILSSVNFNSPSIQQLFSSSPFPVLAFGGLGPDYMEAGCPGRRAGSIAEIGRTAR